MSFVTTESANTVEDPQTVNLGANHLGNFPLSQTNLNRSGEDDQLILLVQSLNFVFCRLIDHLSLPKLTVKIDSNIRKFTVRCVV